MKFNNAFLTEAGYVGMQWVNPRDKEHIVTVFVMRGKLIASSTRGEDVSLFKALYLREHGKFYGRKQA